jgi:hypothetical protein
MLVVAFVVAVVFILGLGAFLQWWGRREFSGTNAEVSAESRTDLRTTGLPSEASLQSGDYGVGSAANAIKNIR